MNDNLKSILSGILISIGSFIYLKVGGIIGAVLFAFGIFCIVKYGLGLFTGVAGTEIKEINKWRILLFNIIGSVLGGYILAITYPSMYESSMNLISLKVNDTIQSIFFKAIACGLIVDLSVFLSKKESNSLPLFIGIPLFIMCGFNHSIADAGYYGIYLNLSTVNNNFDLHTNILYILYYLIVIIGNYIGCNLRRIFIKN